MTVTLKRLFLALFVLTAATALLLQSGQLTEAEAREQFSLGKDARDWTVSRAQSDVRKSVPERAYIRPSHYRPFDVRYTYYTATAPGFL